MKGVSIYTFVHHTTTTFASRFHIYYCERKSVYLNRSENKDENMDSSSSREQSASSTSSSVSSSSDEELHIPSFLKQKLLCGGKPAVALNISPRPSAAVDTCVFSVHFFSPYFSDDFKFSAFLCFILRR